jgi:hypothetical protein
MVVNSYTKIKPPDKDLPTTKFYPSCTFTFVQMLFCAAAISSHCQVDVRFKFKPKILQYPQYNQMKTKFLSCQSKVWSKMTTKYYTVLFLLTKIYLPQNFIQVVLLRLYRCYSVLQPYRPIAVISLQSWEICIHLILKEHSVVFCCHFGSHLRLAT